MPQVSEGQLSQDWIDDFNLRKSPPSEPCPQVSNILCDISTSETFNIIKDV